MDRLTRLFCALMILLGALASTKAFSADSKKVAVMWVGESVITRTHVRGFLPRMKQIAPDLEVTVKMNLPDMKTAEKLFREYESQMNGIVFLRSSGAKFLATAAPKIPCFVGGTNNPEFLGTIKNLDAPEDNITGVTYYLPYEKRFGAIKALFPNVKSVCLLVEKDHPSAEIERKGTSEECAKLGIEYNEVAAGNKDELLNGAKEMGGKVNLFILAVHALVEKNTPELVKVSHAAKVPIFSYGDVPIEMGALAGLVAREEVLGSMLADSVVDVVVKGVPVAKTPVKMDPDPQITINESEMNFFALKPPPSVMAKARLIQKR